MKLKDGFVTFESDGEQILVSTGDVKFAGLVRSNKTAAFIVDCLKEHTNEEQIINKMFEKYDVEKEVAAQAVRSVIEKLHTIGAIDE